MTKCRAEIKPHICFVSDSIYPVLTGSDFQIAGGAQLQQTIVARALRERGYRVSVLTGDFGAADSVTGEGIEIYHTPPTGTRGIKGLRRIHPRMTDVVRRLHDIRPDIVYFRGAGGVLGACAWYARRAGAMAVFAAASDEDFHPGRIFGLERREVLLFHLGLRFCDRIAVQNDYQRSILRRRFNRIGLLVPNCYHEESYLMGNQRGPVVWIGQIDANKRPEIFIRLAERHPDVNFIMVGGPRRSDPMTLEFFESVRVMASRVRNLTFSGFVPPTEAARVYDGASVLVNTSRVEGLPNTFLQAWIRGVPTLSFVAPVVADGATGTIACTDEGHMDRTLSALVSDEDEWKSSSGRVRRYFEKVHSVEAAMPAYTSLFELTESHYASHGLLRE